MRWEQQSIDTKYNSKHHKTMRKQAKSKTKQGFLKKDVFSPLVYASLQWLSPPTNVHKSYRNDDTHQYTLPLFVTNRQMNQEGERKEKNIWIWVKYDPWRVQDEWENKAQTKDKNIFIKNATKHKEHDMLRMMEHDVDLGMT